MSDPHVKAEEQYFQEQEARLREKMREELERKAEEERRKREIAQSLGTDDQSVIDRVTALGLDSEVLPALHLLPLVGIAWADGSVSARERSTILKAVGAHGIEPGTPAATFVASLLEERPSETLRQALLGILKDVLAAKNLKPQSLIQACEDVASASGGLFGLGSKISPEELESIREIAAVLGPEADQKVKDHLG